MNMKPLYENKQMRILSAIGIVLVVAGHLGYNLLDVGELFPYYSFHVFIFLFVSGYFYKSLGEDNIPAYIGKKAMALLVPYYIWNVVYGIIAAALRLVGFTIGSSISLKTLFLSPFLDGHQFMYHFPAWFVPVLFVIEVINVCMRRILTILRLNNEWLIFGACLLLGIATVWLAIGGHVWGYYKIPGRILFMLPGFQLGRLYQEKLEKHDTLPAYISLPIVMFIQILITIWCGGLAFSAVWCTSFANGPIMPYITVATGIAFWLHIARLIEQIEPIADKVAIVGRNTFAIMMHHIFAFFIVKCILYGISIYTPLCAEFDRELFFSDINFLYLPGGSEAGKWVYLAAGILLPLVIVKIQEAILPKRLYSRIGM